MTREEQIEAVYVNYRLLFISREEAISQIMALGEITRIGAEDILNRWPTIKRERP